MKKIFLVILLVGAGCIGGYYKYLLPWILPWIDSPGDLILSLIGGVSVMFLLSSLAAIYRIFRDRSLINSASSAEPFRDGKMVAAVGRIEPLGRATLNAPFSRRECVVYSYEVSHESVYTHAQSHGEISETTDCSGYGMIPCKIRTTGGTGGDVGLLGFPILEEWPATAIESPLDRERAQDYIHKAVFAEIAKNPVRAFHEFKDLYNDPDSHVRKDIGKDIELNDSHRIEERAVPVGAPVCAMGIYSAQRNGLITKMDLGGSMIRLLPAEDSVQTVKQVGKGRKAEIGFGILFFLLAHAFLVALLFFSSPKRMAERNQWSAMHEALLGKNFAKLEMLLQCGVNPDARDDPLGETLLYSNTRVPQAVRLLLQYHADPNARSPSNDETPLFPAVLQAEPDTVRMLIRAGADVNAVSRKPWGKVRPIDEAIRREREDMVKVLVDAGADDPRVTAANGTSVGLSDEPVRVCLKYSEAISKEDRQTMQKISTARGAGFFQAIDFKECKSTDLKTIDEVTGYRNDSAATIHLTGTTEKGERGSWIYQLVHDSEGWKIKDTYIVSH